LTWTRLSSAQRAMNNTSDGEGVDEPRPVYRRRWPRVRILLYLVAFVVLFLGLSPDRPNSLDDADSGAYYVELFFAAIQTSVIMIPVVLIVETGFRMGRR